MTLNVLNLNRGISSIMNKSSKRKRSTPGDKQIDQLRIVRRDLAKSVCTFENYVFSTRAPRRAPTYYFEALFEEGIVLARIRQQRTYGTKVSIYLNGRRRFVRPKNMKKVTDVWDDRRLRDKAFGRILEDKKVPLFSEKPMNGDQVIAISRTARFRSLGRIENLGNPSPLSTLELGRLIDKYPDEQIAFYL